MKRILCISGSRADYGLLEWPVKVLREAFEVTFEWLAATSPSDAFAQADWMMADKYSESRPDCLLILGDRWEILQAAIAAHLQRVPIAHIGGGDETYGSYDHQMRDCISLLSKWHFVTSDASERNLSELVSRRDITNIGNIALDYMMHGDWRGVRPYAEPYVVVSYQPETIDGTNEFPDLVHSLDPYTLAIFFQPNNDAGSDTISRQIALTNGPHHVLESLPRAEFLNLLYHCDEFIGNSSAMLYEAPALGVKCRMIGKRQQGRVAPTGDGKASERIKEVLCRELL